MTPYWIEQQLARWPSGQPVGGWAGSRCERIARAEV